MAKILITTGIFPPQIGGPAQYAKNLKVAFEKGGHLVSVSNFNIENSLPTGARHLYFFIKIIPKVLLSDYIIALDTFSVGWPTVFAAKIFGKKCVIRTGGDFLWEQYNERTGKKVLLRNFYQTENKNFSFKEKLIYKITKWTLQNSKKIVFSTNWQRDIFIPAYGLKKEDTLIIENYYGEKVEGSSPKSLLFIASTRDLKWKNIDLLNKIFTNISKSNKEVKLFTDSMPFEPFMEKIKSAYAVILVSLGDISPNMILDSIRLSKPFICTREVGVFDRIMDAGIFVDPLDEKEIEEAILQLLDKDEYEKALHKVRSFSFTHSWQEIAEEFMDLYKQI